MTNILKYWELFEYGTDGEIYEIIESPVSDFLGNQVQLKGDHSTGVVLKRVGTYHDNSSETLVTSYGAVTGATFRRIENYVEISLSEALDRMRNHETVYLKYYGDYTVVERYTDFEDIDLVDFDDLMDAEFYIKK